MKAFAVLTLCSISLVLRACAGGTGSPDRSGDRYLITRDQVLESEAVNVLDAGEAIWWERINEIRFLRQGDAGRVLGSCVDQCQGAVIVRLQAGGGS